MFRRKLARGGHLGQRCRRVTKHAQVVAGVVTSKGHKNRDAGSVGVSHCGKVVSQSSLYVPQVRQGGSSIEVRDCQIPRFTIVANRQYSIEEFHRLRVLPCISEEQPTLPGGHCLYVSAFLTIQEFGGIERPIEQPESASKIA
ncbi:hypothetical protein [Promicromonospora sp. NPDC023987]|uniref:hypothetical protein n=1 Tax=Promicromonospora sp. NPDC023987 TaxID=3155360 RepID=UPI0033E402AA